MTLLGQRFTVTNGPCCPSDLETIPAPRAPYRLPPAMLQNRRIVWPAYLIAFSLTVIPPIDAVMQTMPIRFGELRWRWGVFGLLSNAMMIPMIGLLIAFVVASAFE